MESLERIFNSNNCISIEDGEVLFWGCDLNSKKIKITPYIRSLIEKYDFPENEVIELFDDDTFQFFKEVYTIERSIS